MKKILLLNCLVVACNVFGTDHHYNPTIELNVIHDPLDNSKCTAWNKDGARQNVFVSREPEDLISGILLHYTACQSKEDTYRAYYKVGVSAHFLLEHNGDAYCNVHPENIAFHAGASNFAGLTSLNKSFIGIEHVNPGYVETNVLYNEKFGQPQQICGDERSWFSFSEPQFKSSSMLTYDLQQQYQIPGWMVLTHADVAIGRKSDIGPMYDFQRAFSEYGAGYYPKISQINDDFLKRKITDQDYIDLVRIIGYKSNDVNVDDETKASREIKAFQMHYSTKNISGELTDLTKESIFNMCVDLYDYKDPITKLQNDRFRNALSEWINNKRRENWFSEYLSVK